MARIFVQVSAEPNLFGLCRAQPKISKQKCQRKTSVENEPLTGRYAKLAEKKWKHSFSIRIFYPRKTIHLFISRHILLVFKKKRMNGLEAKPFTNLSSLHKSRGVPQSAPTPFGSMWYGFPYWARAGAAISAAFKFAGFTFFFPRSYFFLSAWYFLLSYKRFFITNFVTCVRKFVTKTFCAERKKLLADREKYQGKGKMVTAESSAPHGW